MIHPSIAVSLLAVTLTISASYGQPVIQATGQLLIPGDPDLPSTDPGHYDTYEHYVYQIDVLTGTATAVSPAMTELPAALAGKLSRDLIGFASGFASGSESGQLVQLDPVSGSQTNIGSDIGVLSTALDITADGQGFILPFATGSATQQVHSIDLSSGQATPIGSATAIGDAIDLARGTPLGSAEPYIISLGSVGNMLYGVDLDTDSLVSVDSTTGEASVVGTIGAVGMSNGGAYSGFSALTGVDEDLDGDFDALYGSVNQFYDGNGAQRLGGIARFDLKTGDWTLVGTNPGVLFLGFGSYPAQPGGCHSADVNGDGEIDTADIRFVVSNLGAGGLGEAGTPGDADGDGVTAMSDITFVVAKFGCFSQVKRFREGS